MRKIPMPMLTNTHLLESKKVLEKEKYGLYVDFFFIAGR
jgi:hypothetical protein